VKDPESGNELVELDAGNNSTVVSKLKARLVNKEAELTNNRVELVNKEAELDGLRLRLKSQEFPQE
jgi:hypothetical protein